jgi:transcriptional regulator with XRE-family HTH domain
MADAAPESRFHALAAVIAAARQDHLLTQGALARALKVTQQSVSRWEAGTHRPSVEQIPELAAALELDPDELRLIAGYAMSASPRAPHFPFDRLAPETFEQVVADLLKAQHPQAEVRIEGGRGHEQSGIDVRALFGDRQWVVQCKQVARFGPADVAKAIAAVSIEADRKILALSRIASPRAADVVRKTPGWEVWDQDDISRMIRSLPGGDQDRIADTYFPGQRMALLGRRESGPWLTTEQFFAPFAKPGAYFSHEWRLQGRDRELLEVSEALRNEHVTLLVAAGGMGKSRLLRAAFDAAAPPSTIVRFLSAARDPSRESLEALGVGDKLLVVDDAHDRDGLSVVIEYAADLRNRAKLLFATRPYALQRLENELGRFGYEKIRRIELGRLPRQALEAVVGEVLKANGIGRHWAEPVAAIAGENPLIATMAARVVASGAISLVEARDNDVLRHMVLSRFAGVITGTIGDAGDAPLLRAMLDLVAVMQPVHLNDRRLGELLEATTDFSAAQASRALKILVKGGVIYKRGAAYRLMPDVLGDYLIDESCVEDDGRLTLFAEKIIDAVGREQLEQVMVNLGRMDWRRNKGDPANSRLLDRAWQRLDGVEHSWDPRFGAVRAVAMYQPRQALAYVQRHLSSTEVARELTPILRNVAFTPEYRLDVCRLLWEIGRDDDRPLGQHPNHPIRVLAELCGFGEYKPINISEEVAEFAFSLMADDKAWRHHYSPLDILEPLLSGVVESNRSHGRSISIGRYFLKYDYAVGLRSRVINCVMSLLSHPDDSVAVRAARLLGDMVRMPMGLGGQSPDGGLRERYNSEFALTLERLRERVASGQLAAATMITAVQGIEWHARFNEGPLSVAARAVFDALPDTLAFRLRAAMVDGAQRGFRGQLDYEEWSTDNPWLDDLVAELRRTFGTPQAVLSEMSAAMTELKQASVNPGSAYILVSKLVEDDLDAAEAVLEFARDPSSEWRTYAYSGLREILERSPERGRAIIGAALDGEDRDPDFAQRAVSAMGGLRRALTPADVSLLRRSISSCDEVVVISSLNALQWDRSLSDQTAFDLLMLAPLDAGAHVFATVAHHLQDRQRKLLRLLGGREVEAMFTQLRHVRQLPGGHWTEELYRHLAINFPLQFARFLLARADAALGGEDEDGEVELLGYGYHDGKLGFDKSSAAAETLALAWDWLIGHREGDGYTIYRAVEMFACMFDLDARVVVDFLDSKIDTASPIELRLIGRLLRHTHHFFVFRERPFVERLLDRVAAADPGELEHVRDSLAAAALGGMKSGMRGEPMPRDVEAKAKAENVLSRLSRFSPAYPLYEVILKNAEADIASAIREGEILDELE